MVPSLQAACSAASAAVVVAFARRMAPGAVSLAAALLYLLAFILGGVVGLVSLPVGLVLAVHAALVKALGDLALALRPFRLSPVVLPGFVALAPPLLAHVAAAWSPDGRGPRCTPAPRACALAVAHAAFYSHFRDSL